MRPERAGPRVGQVQTPGPAAPEAAGAAAGLDGVSKCRRLGPEKSAGACYSPASHSPPDMLIQEAKEPLLGGQADGLGHGQPDNRLSVHMHHISGAYASQNPRSQQRS